jgi:hypothetical protein
LTKIKIDEIIYQPEAAGDYNLWSFAGERLKNVSIFILVRS